MATSILSRIEVMILERLGGNAWTDATVTLQEAEARRHAALAAVGLTSSRWWTDETTSPKLGKAGLPTRGVTLHAAKDALRVWVSLPTRVQTELAAAFDVTPDDVLRDLGISVCPCSSVACITLCVVAHSANSQFDVTQISRLVRTMMVMFAPKDALTITAHGLERLRTKFGDDGARWRVNVSDDIRWELVAPGLLKIAPKAYAYTKWSPKTRPEVEGLRVVYSATEHTKVQDIVSRCQEGHTVALVLDLAKREPLPATWAGINVVDGDKTDDLWDHPHGVIVGLRLKAPTLELKQKARELGFAHKPVAPVWASPESHIVTDETQIAA